MQHTCNVQRRAQTECVTANVCVQAQVHLLLMLVTNQQRRVLHTSAACCVKGQGNKKLTLSTPYILSRSVVLRPRNT